MAIVGMNLINASVTKAIMEGEVEYILAVRVLIEDTLDNLIVLSPIFTGYYASNHRIAIRRGGSLIAGSSSPKLFPASKPRVTTKDMYVANIEPAKQEELSKLDIIKIGDTILISTAVPYADEIERTHAVYSAVEHLFQA